MANRRMFAKTITNSGYFLMMPPTTQLLYIHMGMNADDDGFVEAYTIMNMIRANEGDLELLIRKGFLEIYPNFVVWIVGWRENNELRWDRYKPSPYQYLKPGFDFKYEDKNAKYLGGIINQPRLVEGFKFPNKIDELIVENSEQMELSGPGSTVVVPNGNPGKVRLGKVRLGNNIYVDFVNKFNAVSGRNFKTLPDKAKKALKNRFDEGYSIDDIMIALENALKDPFHRESNYKYLTPEFFTRAEKIEKFLNFTPPVVQTFGTQNKLAIL